MVTEQQLKELSHHQVNAIIGEKEFRISLLERTNDVLKEHIEAYEFYVQDLATNPNPSKIGKLTEEQIDLIGRMANVCNPYFYDEAQFIFPEAFKED